VSLEEEKTKTKEKRAEPTPMLATEIKKTRRAYLKSIIIKKRALGIPLTDIEKGQLIAFEALDEEE